MPHIPQGGSASSPYDITDGAGSGTDGWIIAHVNYGILGSSNGGVNGYNVTFDGANLTVTVPVGATIDTGYEVSYEESFTRYLADFDIVAPVIPSPGTSRKSSLIRKSRNQGP